MKTKSERSQMQKLNTMYHFYVESEKAKLVKKK